MFYNNTHFYPVLFLTRLVECGGQFMWAKWNSVVINYFPKTTGLRGCLTFNIRANSRSVFIFTMILTSLSSFDMSYKDLKYNLL